MSIFGKIMGAIFGSHPASAAPAGGAASGSAPAGAAPRQFGTGRLRAPAEIVDVAADRRRGCRRAQGREAGVAHLDRRPDEGARHRFQPRRTQGLAKELGYTGDMNDSASMNVWLHKQVMSKLAANGGKLPPEIKH